MRSVQVHGETVERAEAGQRVAVAVAAERRRRPERGDALVEPGAYPVSFRLDVELTGDVADGARVQVCHGTTAVSARVVRAGERNAQLRLERPLVTARGDRVVLASGVDRRRRSRARSRAAAARRSRTRRARGRARARARRRATPPRRGHRAARAGGRVGVRAGVACRAARTRSRDARGESRAPCDSARRRRPLVGRRLAAARARSRRPGLLPTGAAAAAAPTMQSGSATAA